MKIALISPAFAACPVFAAVLLAISTATPTLEAHEFDDGFVDRSVRVTIRERLLTIEYSVGCNPVTMQDCLDTWSKSGSIPASPPTIEEDPVEEDPVEAEADSKTKELEKLESSFRAELLKRIAAQFELRCSGNLLTIKPVSVAGSPRHHVNAVATLQVDLPVGNPLDLELKDSLFEQQTGEVRYSAKALGNTMMSRSNVAPTIIRAKRLKLTGLTPKQRQEQTKIECQLVFVEDDNN